MDLLVPETELGHPNQRRILIESTLGAGDIVVLTGVIRDLHRGYPSQFAVEVRTSYPEFWYYNPHLRSFPDCDTQVERVVCGLKHLSTEPNAIPRRYFDLFLADLRNQIGVEVSATRIAGDIHLSPNERLSPDPVNQLLGAKIPYWIISTGGKYDITTKWWSSERHQKVVDTFKDRILFVQVGLAEHHHPPLNGVLDLRGRTSIRELVRLMYGAQGVLCGITSLMHLAAAVPLRYADRGERPCVVIAGGREPSLLVQYPGHQFIHNVGMLPCSRSGCWKTRTKVLNDGSEYDRPEHQCTELAGELPRCMDLITVADVCRRIEGYFEGGVTEYLQGYQIEVARRADRSRSRRPTSAFLPQIEPRAVVASATPADDCSGPDRPASPAQILLLTGADAQMEELVALTSERLQSYASRHGYGCHREVFAVSNPRHPVWVKISAIRQALKRSEIRWILWMDADAVVMNQEQKIEVLLHPDADLIIGSDHNGTNAGIMLIRVCDWSRRFFDAVDFLGNPGYNDNWAGDRLEQACLRHLLKTFPEQTHHVYLAEQHVLNSYLENYQDGDFIVHLAGIDPSRRVDLMKQLLAGSIPATPFQDGFLDGR